MVWRLYIQYRYLILNVCLGIGSDNAEIKVNVCVCVCDAQVGVECTLTGRDAYELLSDQLEG